MKTPWTKIYLFVHVLGQIAVMRLFLQTYDSFTFGLGILVAAYTRLQGGSPTVKQVIFSIRRTP